MRISRFSNAFLLAFRISAVLMIIFSLLLAGSVSVHPALATGSNTWTVNVLTDSSLTTCSANTGSAGPACELRDAINEATSGDIIKFSTSGTIVLHSTLPMITKTLTIDGTGGNVTVSGNAIVEIMQTGTTGNLTLKALTLSNGHTAVINGGAINNNGTLNVVNSIFVSNSASSSNGGAIYSGGTLNITNSTFSGNSTSLASGGAIYSSGPLSIVNSTFSGNSAPLASGGAIYSSGPLIVSGSTFLDNTAGNSGAISIDSSDMATITNSIFSGNSSGVDGGAIETGGVLNVSNSTFSDNLAGVQQSYLSGAFGGAIRNDGTLNIANSTFSNNSACCSAPPFQLGASTGGAIASGGALNIANSTFSSNSATYGGAISIASTLNIANSTFFANLASIGGAIDKGGVSISTLNNSLLINDTGADCVSNLAGTLIGAHNMSDGSCPGTLAAATGIATTLADNGGPTQTLALLSGSNAIDAVPNGACVYVSSGTNPLFTSGANVTTDQRGVNRPRGALCDIGAYEFVAPKIDSIGIYRAGTFYLRLHNSTGNADLAVGFTVGTKPYPIVGDWTGSGFDTVGVFNQNNGQFSLRNSNTPGTPDEQFVLGNPNDQPLSGRWLINATNAGVGVFRPSNGLIYLKNALSTGFADYTMVLGIPGDQGLAGDWNGKGFDSPGVYRSSNSTFYLSNQVKNGSVIGDYQFAYGIGGDAPVTGDWIAQGHDGVGLFRQSNGFTYLKNQLVTGYADNSFTYGIAGDVPVAGHWQAIYPPIAPAPVLIAKTAVPSQSNGSADGNNPIGD